MAPPYVPFVAMSRPGADSLEFFSFNFFSVFLLHFVPRTVVLSMVFVFTYICNIDYKVC